MAHVSLEHLTQQLELAQQLSVGRANMLLPQQLPGAFGRVVRAVDHLLDVTQTPAVVGGGWAVWYHGYVGRVTQDLDIALPADKIDEFMRAAGGGGFQTLEIPEGRWPKAVHRETGIQLDILPEHGRPGTPANPAPTTNPHPLAMGGLVGKLEYIRLPSLVELKLAAGRIQDEADVVQLITANPTEADAIRSHCAAVHPQYAAAFNRLRQRALDEQD